MRYWRPVVDLLWPPRCRICNASTLRAPLPWVCPECWEAIEYIKAPFCAHCGQPFAAPPAGIASPQHRCGACLLHPPVYDRARAVGYYHGVLRELIHVMKYHPVYGLVAPLGELLREHFSQHWHLCPPDICVPVPLHWQRLYHREFDQALALARCLGQGVGLPVCTDLLRRQRPTRSQVGLDALQRRQNIQGAFQVWKASRCEGKAILLVDDVYTTGATVAECARLLRRAGASRIEVYTLARVDDPRSGTIFA